MGANDDEAAPILISFVTATNEQWFNILTVLTHFDVLPETRDQLEKAIAKHVSGDVWSWGTLSSTIEEISEYCERYFTREEVMG